jgi:conserved oligomeric Golgi complex subunit 4
MRDFLSYAKERLDAPELHSNAALFRACTPLARLLQISKLMTVDDLDDVLDLISASKRKGNWDLTLDDAKSYLSLRVEFEESRVNEMLRIPDDD